MAKKDVAKRLSDMIRPNRVYTVAEIARSLGVSRQAVTAWCDGTASPSLKHAVALERLLGIPAQDWVE